MGEPVRCLFEIRKGLLGKVLFFNKKKVLASPCGLGLQISTAMPRDKSCIGEVRRSHPTEQQCWQKQQRCTDLKKKKKGSFLPRQNYCMLTGKHSILLRKLQPTSVSTTVLYCYCLIYTSNVCMPKSICSKSKGKQLNQCKLSSIFPKKDRQNLFPVYLLCLLFVKILDHK